MACSSHGFNNLQQLGLNRHASRRSTRGIRIISAFRFAAIVLYCCRFPWGGFVLLGLQQAFLRRCLMPQPHCEVTSKTVSIKVGSVKGLALFRIARLWLA